MLISAHHIGGTESFVIEIEANKVQGLIEQFDGDYLSMANHLKLMQNKMCLLNPVSRQALTSSEIQPGRTSEARADHVGPAAKT